MSKEEIDLLKVQLLLDYYKNKDITQHYRTLIENNIVFDNDTLDVLNDINETIYITKFNKYKELQQENKKYKEVIDKLKTNIENDIDGFRTINEFGESNEILELLDIYLDILKEVE